MVGKKFDSVSALYEQVTGKPYPKSGAKNIKAAKAELDRYVVYQKACEIDLTERRKKPVTGAVHDCKGPLDWDSAKDWLRTYTVPIGFDEVSRDLGVRQEIYYIRNKDFEEYRQWLCDTKQEIISRDGLSSTTTPSRRCRS